MRKILVLTATVLVLGTALVGCAAQTTESHDTGSQPFSVSEKETAAPIESETAESESSFSAGEESQSSEADETSAESSASTSSPESEAVPQSQSPVPTQAPKESAAKTAESVPPATTQVPKETSTPEPTVPPATEAPAPVEEPAPTEPPAPDFNVQTWIDFAASYAKSIGLNVSPDATACWDAPITAGAHCQYLERDITDRLNRYGRDAEITDVWIWAESRSDGSYDLFIGYG